MKRLIPLCVMCLVAAMAYFAAGPARSAEPAKSAATSAGVCAPLGAPDWRPSPQCPIGWRGDWSGRYPNATPPTQWGRWAKTSIRDLRCQGDKPKNADAAGEALPFGRLEDWLIVGPFVVEDAAKALDQEVLSAEAERHPAVGDKANDKAWLAFHAGGNNQHGGAGLSGVEFYRALTPTSGPSCAYAATNIYAPSAVKADLRIGMPAAMKVWLNGKLIASEPKAAQGGKTIPIELAQGWNRLLCKQVAVLTGKPDSIHNWRFTATLSPQEKSFDYETRNVAWMTPLPAPSTALPIIVGDKIFVMSQYSDLLCLNKADGRILWLRTNNYYDAMTDLEKAAKPELKDQVEPEFAKLKAMNEDLVRELNAAISPAGLSSDKHKALADKLSAKGKQETKVNELLVKLGVTKRPPHIQHVGCANGTPTSDGQFVWAIFGGGIYSGPMTVVCYDLDGKRIWARGWSDVDAGEHGDHCSPLLVEGKLVYQTIRNLTLLDAKTGQTLWSVKPVGPGDNGGGSPSVVKIGGETVIVGPRRDMYRLSDGRQLHTPDAQKLGHNLGTPVVNDGVLYQTVGWGDNNYAAFRLPEAMADKLDPQMLYRVKVDPEGKYKDATFTNSMVGSPLYDNGLVYYLTEGGVLHVSDAAKGTPAYVRMLDEMRTRVQWVFWNGACGSPTLAGKYIYLTDDCGITVVIEPGREYKKVAVNTLENYSDGFSQEQTLGTPIFEGRFMYYRSPGYLYCIGGK